MSDVNAGDTVRLIVEGVAEHVCSLPDAELIVRGGKLGRATYLDDAVAVEVLKRAEHFEAGQVYESSTGNLWYRLYGISVRDGRTWKSIPAGNIVHDDIPVRPLRRLVPEVSSHKTPDDGGVL